MPSGAEDCFVQEEEEEMDGVDEAEARTVMLTERDIPKMKALMQFQTNLLTGQFNEGNIIDAAEVDPLSAYKMFKVAECKDTFNQFYRARMFGAPSAQQLYVQNLFCVASAVCPYETEKLVKEGFSLREGESESSRSKRAHRLRKKLERCSQRVVKSLVRAMNVNRA